MSDYTNGFGGATKDSINATILGAEMDAEFDNIETMSATKANKIASPVENDIILQSASGDLVAAGWGLPNVNADITSSDEEINGLDGLTASRAVVTNGSGIVTTSAATAAEVAHLSGVTSNIQTQLDAKLEQFQGALVYGDSISVAATTNTRIDFDYEVYDTDSIHDTVTNPSRLTVPTGATKIRLNGSFQDGSGGTGVYRIQLYKNGSSYLTLDYRQQISGYGSVISTTNVLSVTGGDYFEFYVYVFGGSGMTISGGTSFPSNLWASLEVLE